MSTYKLLCWQRKHHHLTHVDCLQESNPDWAAELISLASKNHHHVRDTVLKKGYLLSLVFFFATPTTHLICVGVSPACLWAFCVPDACGSQKRARNPLKLDVNLLKYGCEPPYWYWELNLEPLEEPPVLRAVLKQVCKYLKLHFINLFVCVWVYAIGLRNHTQVIRVGGKYLYLLSHLPSP